MWWFWIISRCVPCTCVTAQSLQVSVLVSLLYWKAESIPNMLPEWELAVIGQGASGHFLCVPVYKRTVSGLTFVMVLILLASLTVPVASYWLWVTVIPCQYLICPAIYHIFIYFAYFFWATVFFHIMILGILWCTHLKDRFRNPCWCWSIQK